MAIGTTKDLERQSYDDDNFIGQGVIIKSGAAIPPHDYGSVAYPDTVTEEYTFKQGGSGGTVVKELRLVYTDATKAELSYWEFY